MRTNISFIKKAVISLSILVVAVNILSLYLINGLNLNIVNSALYNYGLKFEWGWAARYWTCLNMLFASVASCIALVVFSAASVTFLGKTQGDGPRVLSSFTLASVTSANIFSLILFFFIDNIVNKHLYESGLQFSLDWYEPYFVQSSYFLATQILSVALGMISFVMVFFNKRGSTRLNSQKIVSLCLLVVGAVLVGFSVSYEYYTSSLVGLGLIFWGVIMGYVSTEDYVKREVLEATTLSYLTTLNEMLETLQLREKAVFLPSKYFRDSKTNKVYIAKSQSGGLLNLEAIVHKTVNDKQLEATLMVAPGNELARLFEKTLGRSFTTVDFSFFEINMPKLLVAELELAQSVEIIAEGNIVKVKMKNPISFDFSKKMSQYEAVNSVGTPLSSAIACALANSTGKPVVIKNHQISLDGKTIEIDYVVMKEKGSRFG
jgi:hypothetical protein